jgi:hypothetical protein
MEKDENNSPIIIHFRYAEKALRTVRDRGLDIKLFTALIYGFSQ